MPQLFTNNAIALLDTPIGPSDLTFDVQAGLGALYPQPVAADDFFLVTIEDYPATRREIVKIIGRSGDTFHVGSRGWEGTTPDSWPVDVLVDHRITAGTLHIAVAQYAAAANGTINNPGSTTIVDVFHASTINKTCKWMITVDDLATNKVSAAEVLAVSRGPLGTPSFTRYAQTGDHISYTINVAQVGNDLQLTITNNALNPLTINILRLQNTSLQ